MVDFMPTFTFSRRDTFKDQGQVGYCQVRSRLLAIIVCYSEAFEWFFGNSLSEFCSEQARALLCKLISHFAMGLNGSLYHYVIM